MFSMAGQTGDIKASMPGFLSVDDPGANDHRNTFEPDPILHVTNEVQVFRIGGAPTLTDIDSAMSLADRLFVFKRSIFEVLHLIDCKQDANILVQMSLVLFDAE